MAKKGRKKTKKDYEARRKRLISAVCIALAAMFLIWTVAGTMLFSFGVEEEPREVSAAPAEQTGNVSPFEAREKEALAEAPEASVMASGQTAVTASELRGIWVSTVANLDYPTVPSTSPQALKAEADIVIHDCYEMGMNAIFLQVRPAADAFYRSAYFPWSRYLTGQQGLEPEDGFDPLAYWVEKAHERGIELHAWINPYRITTSSSDWDRLSWNNPAKGAWNDYVVRFNGNYYFDPGQPAVRDLITAAAVEIVQNYNVDGIHFDDYFYPEQTSSAAFNDTGTYAAYGNGMNLADWRRENVNQLIRQVNDAVHTADPHCVFGVSPMGVWANYGTSSLGSATRGGESYSQRYADSYTWVKNHWIDYIAPQIYWSIGFSAADYAVLANWWSDVVRGTDVKLYIGMADYRVASSSWGWSGTSEILRQLQLNDTLPEISGEIHFRYKSAAGHAGLYELYRGVYASNRQAAYTDPAGAGPSTGLYDISGHWAESYILSLVEKGVIQGMGDGTFRPNAPVTRAQFIKMMATAEGVSSFEDLPEVDFADVPAGSWFTGPIRWAVAQGIASGRSRTTFAPDENITRQEMAVMLHRYYGRTSQETEAALSDTAPEPTVFADDGDISEWAADAVRAVTAAGLMNGFLESDRSFFYPSRNTTRAEAAKVISEIQAKKQPESPSEGDAA